MSNVRERQIAILASCVPGVVAEDAATGIVIRTAPTAAKTLGQLRRTRPDLLLIGCNVPDMPCWTLIRRVRACCPWQRWALACGAELSDPEEMLARSLGAVGVFEGINTNEKLCGLAEHLRPAQPPGPQPVAQLATERTETANQVQINTNP